MLELHLIHIIHLLGQWCWHDSTDAFLPATCRLICWFSWSTFSMNVIRDQIWWGIAKFRYEAPSPGYKAPSSSYDAPSSSYDAPSSSYDAPSTSYDAPSSSYDAPSDSYDGPSSYEAPSYSSSGRDHIGSPKKFLFWQIRNTKFYLQLNNLIIIIL